MTRRRIARQNAERSATREIGGGPFGREGRKEDYPIAVPLLGILDEIRPGFRFVNEIFRAKLYGVSGVRNFQGARYRQKGRQGADWIQRRRVSPDFDPFQKVSFGVPDFVYF